MASDGRVSFRLLGPVEALDAAGAPLALGGPRRQAVLAALLLHRGTSLPVDRVVELLWPDRAPATAATMVHGAVVALRRSLEEGGRPRLLLTRDGGYALDPAAEQVDAARFEQALERARHELVESPRRTARLVAGALAEWRGPALAGVEQPFAREAARRLEELRVRGRELRVDAELRSGHHHEVLDEIEDLVAEYPLREDLCAHLVLALYRCGRQADALAAHRRLRARLVDELGVEPDEALRDLELAVLRNDPALRAPPIGRGTLPVPLGSLEGRAGEVEEVGAMVRTHRLVTLTGPGGVGKARLAVELARRADVEACLVDLAPLTDPALLEETLADAVGVHAEPGQPLARTVTAALGVTPAILVLDNGEHLVAACAGLVQSLLAAAAGLRVLVTSREPLGVPGERVHVVRPLGVPPEGVSSEEAAASPAVRLFHERATAAGARITPAGAGLVRELCRRLDGLPLAIELAASRAATLPLRDLVERLDGRYAVLEAATRTADPRHRSLAATLEWGHALLGAEEQAVFARLAVFRGGFDLVAAAAVRHGGPESGAADAAGDGTDVAVPIARLVASSMVQRDDRPDGSTRFRLLETVRAFAADRLGVDARRVASERHAAPYLGRAEEARSHLFAPASGPWLERLHTERDNLRAALAWSFAHDPARGVRLVDCLWHYWDLRGARDEGLHWVRTALATVGSDAVVRLPLLAAGALLHLGRADLADTERLAGEELTSARALARVAPPLLDRGETVGEDGPSRVRGPCRRIGHRAGTAEALEGLAEIAGPAEDGNGEAAALAAEAASLRAVIGIPRSEGERPTTSRG